MGSRVAERSERKGVEITHSRARQLPGMRKWSYLILTSSHLTLTTLTDGCEGEN
jgi:hypothetical protein